MGQIFSTCKDQLFIYISRLNTYSINVLSSVTLKISPSTCRCIICIASLKALHDEDLEEQQPGIKFTRDILVFAKVQLHVALNMPINW